MNRSFLMQRQFGLYHALLISLFLLLVMPLATQAATVAAGTNPFAVAVNPVTNKTYVANNGSNNVTVIDGATNATSTIAAGTNPHAVAVNSITNKVYVPNYNSANVTVIDGATNATTTVATGQNPLAVAVNPITNNIYVANSGSNDVTIVDGATNATITVVAGNTPYAVAVNPVTNKIYVANYWGNNITVIDGATNATSIVSTGTRPCAVAVNPVTNKIYVANNSNDNVTVIDGATNATVNVAAGANPRGVAVNPVTNRVYVANGNSNYITVIDGTTNVTSNVTAGANTWAVAVNPTTNTIYVGDLTNPIVTVINGATNTTNTLSAGTNPNAVAVNPVTNRIYVANNGSANVTVIDGAVNAISTVAAGAGPFAVAVNPVTKRIYVANQGSANVTVIDGVTGATSAVATGSSPNLIVVNPATNKIYVGNYSSKNVTVIDGATNTTSTVAVSYTPYDVAVNSVTNKIYVANYDSDNIVASSNVMVIDDATNAASAVPVGRRPRAVAVNPVTNKIYVACSSEVTVIDGATNSTITVSTGVDSEAIAVDPATNRIYVANYGSNDVTVIDGATNATSTLAAGAGPIAIAVNSVTGRIYVANYNSNDVTVINGATNTTVTVPAGANPYAIAVNPATDKVYVANQGSSDVTVINGATSAAITIAAGTNPAAVAVNPLSSRIYVANQNSANVTVIDEQEEQAIPLTVTITALPGNVSASPTPTFSLTASSSFSPTPTTVRNVYYQFDTRQGEWKSATAFDGSTGTVNDAASLLKGNHVLYLFAVDGQEATSTNTGLQSSPLIGSIAAYAFTVAPAAPDTTPPTDGTLGLTRGDGQVSLTWTPATDNVAVTGYKLVSSITGMPANCSGTALDSGAATSFIHTGLTNGVPQYYRVCAYDAAGNASPGATASAIPFAATKTWNNAAGGSWGTAANWTPNAVPTASDNVEISLNGTYTVTLDVSATVNSLYGGGVSGKQTLAIPGNTLTVNNPSTFGANGILSLSAGTLTGTGDITLQAGGTHTWGGGFLSGGGALKVESGATLRLTGSNMRLARNIVNDGTIVHASGSIDPDANSTITNNGLFDIQGNVGWNNAYGVPGTTTLTNSGTLRRSGGTGVTTYSTLSLNNNGIVELLLGTGILEIVTGDSTGSFVIGAGGSGMLPTLEHLGGTANWSGPVSGSGHLAVSAGSLTTSGSYSLTGGITTSGGTANLTPTTGMAPSSITVNSNGAAATLNPTGSITSVPTVSIATGALTMNKPVTLAGLNQSSGTLTGSGDITLQAGGTHTWGGGALYGGGALKVESGATLRLTGSNMRLARNIVNDGTIVHASGSIDPDANSTITNNGLFDIQGNVGWNNAYGVPGTTTLTNSGTLRRSGGTGVTTYSTLSLNNNGIVELLLGTGILEIVTGDSTGSFVIGAGGSGMLPTLEHLGGTANWSGPVSGSGHLAVSAGSLTTSGSYSLTGGITTSGGTANLTPTTGMAPSSITVNSNGAAATLNPTGSITSVPTVSIATGALTMNKPVTLAGLNQSSGTLTGSGDITLQAGGTHTWGGGALYGGGALKVESGATLRLTGSNMRLARNIVNDGTIVHASGSIDPDANSTITNNGLFDIQGNVGWNNAYGVPGTTTLTNSGTLRRSGGTGVTTYSTLSLNNNGIVELLLGTGILEIVTGDSTGSFVIGAGGSGMLPTLQHFGGTANWSGPVSGSGHLAVSAGSLTTSGSYSLTGGITTSGGTANLTPTTGMAPSSITVNSNGAAATLNPTGSITSVPTVSIATGVLTMNKPVTLAGLNQSSGTLTGSGDITLQAGGTHTWGGGALYGGGALKVESGATLRLTGSNMRLARNIVNDGTIVHASGSIDPDANSTITNNGLFDIQGNVNWTEAYGVPGITTLTNTGIFRRSGGTGVSTYSMFNLRNNGAVELLLGTGILEIVTGDSTGAFTIGAGGSGMLPTLQHFGGTANWSGPVSGSGHLAVSAGSLTTSGSYSLTGGITTSGGTANLTPTTGMAPSSITVNSNGAAATLNPTGSITSVPTVSIATGVLTMNKPVTLAGLNQSSGTLTGSGDITLQAGGTHTWGGGALYGGGALKVESGATLRLTGSNMRLSRNIVNDGTIVHASGSIDPDANSTITNNGLFDIQGNVYWNNAYGVPGTTTLTNSGTLRRSGGTGVTTYSTLSLYNNGAVELATGTTSFGTPLNNSSSGTISGVATLDLTGVTFTNSGTIAPGSSGAGTFSFMGNLSLGTGSTTIGIGGITAGSQHDQIAVSGAATLAGTLNVSLINSFVPAIGDSFTIVTFGSRSGTFAATNLPALGAGQKWNIAYNDSATPRNVVLSVVADAVAPTVQSTAPLDGATDIFATTAVTASFSEQMDAATIDGTTFTLYDGATPVAGSVSYGSGTNTARFTPSSPLSYNTTYTATITTGVKDLAGNSLAANTVWTFTTWNLMGGSIQGTATSFTSSNVVVTTLAGSGTAGSTNATGTAASFNYPKGITTDGTNLFIADSSNHRIRKIDISTGVVTTLAGSGTANSSDGTGTGASFNGPQGITTDGTNLFITDYTSNKIRKIVINTGVVTTLAGSGIAGSTNGTGTGASFYNPTGITTDGTNLFVADHANHLIRKIVISTGVVTTLAGSGIAGSADGTGTSASFNTPDGITTDGTNLFVVDHNNHKIRQIVISSGVVTTLAGSGIAGSADGTGTAASFYAPYGISMDGTNLFVGDYFNQKIRQIVISTGVVSTLAGTGSDGSTDGTGTEASFFGPLDTTTDGMNLFVTDQNNHKIRKISPDTTPPAVSSTNPITGATGVMPNSNVTITWNENIDCTTVNTTNITIDSGGWSLFSCSSNQAVFTTSGQTGMTPYTVTVGTAVKDIAGNALASDYIFSFTTGTGACNWNSTISGNWSDGTKWSCGHAPGTNDDAFITIAGTYTVTLDTTPVTVNSLNLGHASSGSQTVSLTTKTLNINSASSIKVKGKLSLNGGIVNGPGVLDNAGTIVVSGSASTINGNITSNAGSMIRLDYANLTVANGFTNNGTIQLMNDTAGWAGNVTLAVTTGTLTNAPGGVIDILEGTPNYYFSYISANIDNQGTINSSNSFTLNLNKASATYLNSGTINVNQPMTISNLSSFTNTGTISIASGKTFTVNGGTFNHNSGGSISGAGTLTFSGTTPVLNLNSDFTSAVPAINFNNATVNGPGNLINASGKTVTLNASIIASPLDNAGTIKIAGNSSITGSLTTRTGSMIRLDYANLMVANGFTNNGTIQMMNDTPYWAGNPILTVTNGTLTNAPGGVIDILEGSTNYYFPSISANIDNQGTFNSSNSTTLNFTKASATYSNSGTININQPMTISNLSSFSNTGTISIASAKTFTINGGTFNHNGGGNITGAGIMTFSGTTPAINLNTDFTSAVATINFNNATINGPGNLINASGKTIALSASTVASSLDNSGTIKIAGNSSITGSLTTRTGSMIRLDYANLTVANGFTNNGTIQMMNDTPYWAGNSILTVTNGTLTNAPGGVIDILEGAPKYYFPYISANIDNQGTFNSSNSTTLNFTKASATYSNSGTINVNQPMTITGNASFFNTGTISIASGKTFSVSGGALTNATTGLLQGSGTLAVSGTTFSNAGMITGDTAGTAGKLTLTGAFPETATGVVNIDIGGITAVTQYDQIAVSGAATLNGTLNVSLINGFVPAIGNSFTIMTYGSHTGTFAITNLPALGVHEKWDISYNAGSVVLSVTAANSAPILAAIADQAMTEDTPLNITLSATDVDGDPISYTVSGGSAGSVTATIVGNILTLTPAADYNSAVAIPFTVIASDGNGGSDSKTFSITVTNANDAPTATSAAITTAEDTASAPVTPSISDPDAGDSHTFAIVNQPAHGTAAVVGNKLVYTPAANYYGPDSFTYRATDAGGLSVTGTATATVTPVNDPPVAIGGALSATEDTTASGTLAASDIDSVNLTYSIVTQGSKGTVTITNAATGAYSYTPNPDANGADSFTFKANDGFLDSNTATVTVAIAPVNDAPVLAAIADQAMDEDTPLTITLSASDADNDPIGYTVSGGSAGTVTATVAGTTLTLTPAANYHSAIAIPFTVVASDGNGGSASKTFNVTVATVNDAPVADNQSIGTTRNSARAITLDASDADGDPLSYAVTAGPAHGTLSGTGAALLYTPAANYTGADSFTFTANDGTVNSNVATVSITVTFSNSTPVANAQSATTAEDTPLAVTLGTSDADGDPLTYAIVAQPAHGTLSGTAPNLTYTPAANYNGADSFTFKASDSFADSNTAQVTLAITPVNDAPVAEDQSASTTRNNTRVITLGATDADNDPLTYTVMTQPANGTLSGTGEALSYTPNHNYLGADSFTFKAGDGTADSNVATVTIAVAMSNVAPAANGQAVTTAEDIPTPVTLTATDADGDPLTYTVATQPAHGTLTGTGANLTYTPAADYNGTDSFTFTASDSFADSNVATVTLTITPVNDAPTISGVPATTVTQGNLYSFTASGSDVDGDPLTYSISGTPGWATFDPATRTLSGTPTNADVGVYNNIIISVFDGTATVSLPAFSITVNSKLTPVITWANPAAITYGTALSATQLNATASVPGSFVYAPDSAAVLPAGTQTLSVSFTPTDTATYSTATASVSIVVSKAAATATLGALAATYDGTAKQVTVTTVPAGLAVAVTYNGAPAAPISAGSYPVVATITDPNYSGSITGTLVIAQATPVITWNNPAAVFIGTALSGTQLNATASVAGTFAYNPAAATVMNSAGNQTLSTTFTPMDAVNYSAATASVTLTVNSKLTPVITWANPAAITHGTALSATQLNATASVPGSFVYAPASAAVLPAGTQTLSVTFTPTDTATYTTATASVSIVVNKAAATVTLGSMTQTYTSSPLTPTATTTPAGLAITWTNAPQTAAGSYAVTATINDTNYQGSASGTFTINTSNVSVTTWPTAAAITYGQTLVLSTLTGGTASVPGSFAWTTPTIAPNAGTAPQSVTFTPTDTINYAAVIGSVSVTVNKATATVTLGSMTQTYTGSALTPTSTTTPAGLAIAWTNAPQTAAGSYAVTATINDTNYQGSASGTFIITTATASVTTWPTASTITYGQTLAASTLTGGTASVPGSFAWTTPTTAPNAGTAAQGVTFTPTDTTNYAPVTGSVSVTVNPAALTVTANNASKTYGSANPALTVSYAGFVNGETAASLTTQPTATTTAVAGSPATAYPITASGGVSGNYSFTYVPGTLTVNPAPLTVTADSKSKVQGSANPALTVSYSGFVNGDTAANLTTQPTATTTALIGSPAGSYPITAGGGVSGSYTFSYVDGILTVSVKTGQTITFGALAAKNYGAADYAPGATATSGLPVTYASSNPAVATIVGGTIHIVGAGSTNITASQAGDATYAPASDVVQPLTVNKAPLTVTADNASRPFNTANPTFTASYSGYVGTDTFASSVTGAPGLTTTAILSSPVGPYPITAAVGTLVSTNYSFSFTAGTLTVGTTTQTISFGALATKTYGNAPFAVSASATSGLPVSFSILSGPATISAGTVSLTGAGTVVVRATQAGDGTYTAATPVDQSFTVNKATLTVTADNTSRPFNTANPAFTASYSGFVGSDSSATSVTGAPGLTTTAILSSPVGPYAITAAAGTLASTNYSFNFVNGTLTVGATTQTISFGALAAKTYGAADYAPGATATSGLTVTFASSNPAVATIVGGTIHIVGAGSTNITASQVGDATYAPASDVVQSLTVNPAPLTVTASSTGKTYGSANPALNYTIAGYLNGDTQAVVTGAPALATSATASSGIGSYPITITAGTLAAVNYSFIMVNGTLSVTPAPLSITAGNASRAYGAANPVVTAFTATGLVGTDSVASVSNGITAPGNAAAGSTHAITPSTAVFGTGSAANYSITYSAGTLTITRASLAVTADSMSKTFGAANPALTWTASGFANGETATVLSGTPVLNTTATTGSSVGAYPITIAAGTLTAANYSISFVNGTLSVLQAGGQTITFNPQATATYGDTPITLAASAASGLPVTFSISGPATLAGNLLTITGAGSVTVTASQAGDANFAAATDVVRTITVNKAALTVTATSAGKSHGTANPALTYTIAGYLNGDTQAVVTGAPALATSATTGSGVGSYPITVTAGTLSAGNYSFTFVNGTLNVIDNTAPITHTITAGAGPDGSVTPAGKVTVTAGGSQEFTIKPKIKGYYVTDVLVDGVSVGPVSSYTFSNVAASHTIQASIVAPDGKMSSNNSGIDIVDCVIAMRVAVGGDTAPTLTPEQQKRGDVAPLVNGKPAPDGRIDLGDAVVILRKVVGLVTW